jgi:FKBP-type peptidyl-prolyl cis-trans isomerase (trigger factor)
LNRVRDQIAVKEGDQEIVLSVDSDANSIIKRLMKAKELMDAVNSQTTEEDKLDAAIAFASAIFGDSQAEQLVLFYSKNAGNIAEVCAQYFEERLCKMITKAQIKSGSRERRRWHREMKQTTKGR